MPYEDSIDWMKLRDDNPIDEVFEHITGLSPKLSNSRYKKYVCPWHADRAPSLTIWHNTGWMKCFGGCEINHRSNADVVDLMCHEYHCNRIEAARRLGLEEIEFVKHTPLVKQPDAVGVEMRLVDWGFERWREAARVMAKRGITEASVLKWHMGYYPSYKTSIRFDTLDGQFERLPCPRVGIPHIVGGEVRYINLRLDMDAARERLVMTKFHKGVVETVRANLKLGQDFETELIYALFGDKYLFMKGSRVYNTIFNGNDLLDWTGDLPTYPHLDIVTAHEGELDAVTLRQELGVPSIATKGSEYLAAATKNVDLLLIVKDNDKGAYNAQGKWINPGIEHAKRTLRMSGRIPGFDALIVKPLDGYKDCNAMAQAGVLRDWWDSLNLGMRSVKHTVRV